MIKIFSYLYEKMLHWSAHQRAPYYLAGVSFAESSFFPVPPDVMLMSMGLAKPRRSWHFAFIATLFSVLGGVFGYLIGYYGMAFVEPYLMSSSYAPYVTRLNHWFEHQGLGLVILAGFSPFPYKIFTITSGMMQMALWPFLMGSIIGRGFRFFLVSGILFFVGEKIEPHLRRYVDRIAWVMVLIIIAAFFLTSCAEREDLAPVEEHQWHSFNGRPKSYVVVEGDTLYSIAFRYDIDYQQMARYNHLQSPYHLHIGQVLYFKADKQAIKKKPMATYRPKQVYPSKAMPTINPRKVSVFSSQSSSKWSWPAKGQIVAKFSPSRGIKGINISGKKGDKIYAASSGVVAYSGNGLAGYGNLIIIKHKNQFLTAYGNNLQNRVKEGQSVKQGQLIADMGKIDRHYWGVHFEIRQMGKPVNPLNYIK